MWAPDYASTEDLASFVRIGDIADDAQLGLSLAAASRSIDARCNRQFGHVDVAEARLYTPRWSRSRDGWLVPIDDLMTATNLVVGVDQSGAGTYALTAYRLRPHNAAATGRPWTELLIPAGGCPTAGGAGSVQVTGLWGWPSVPAAIEQACLLQASRLLSRRDSPFGVAGSPEAGSELRLLSRLDPDVAVAVEPYRRRVWAA